MPDDTVAHANRMTQVRDVVRHVVRGHGPHDHRSMDATNAMQGRLVEELMRTLEPYL